MYFGGGVVAVSKTEVVVAIAVGAEHAAGVVFDIALGGLDQRAPGVGAFGKADEDHHAALGFGPFAEGWEVGSEGFKHGIPADQQRFTHCFDVFGLVVAHVFIHQHGGQMAGVAPGQVFGVGQGQGGLDGRWEDAETDAQPATQQLGE